MPKYCIVIPTSDSLTTLPAAVESALAQQHSDFAVYVSDNASSDGTGAYLLGLRHGRLSVGAHNERIGKTANWNRAFRTAPSCEFFVMLHSDDVLFPGTLTAIERVFENCPRATLVYGNHDMLSLDGAKTVIKSMWRYSYCSSGPRFDRLQTLCNAVSIVGCAFPRAHYEALDGFPREYDFYQDMEFFHRLGRRGVAVYVPVKFGLNRAAPSRPRSRLQFYCEEQEWLAQRVTTWPRMLRLLIIKSWAKEAHAHLRAAYPDMVSEYLECLRRHNIVWNASEEQGWSLPRLLGHRLYKLWLTLTCRRSK